ncbi:MAG: ABC transporter substrate-binding protein [Chloroflexota bacterium]
MKTKLFLLCVALALAMAACSPATTPEPTKAPPAATTAATVAAPTTAAQPTTPPPAPTATTAPKKATEFHGGWPYQLPPDGHFNTFLAAKAINLGIFADLMYQPMAMYKWADGTWIPLMATKWENKGATFEVTLRDAKWADGKAFTAKDVVTTFNIDRLSNLAVWKYITKVEAKDDKTVVFTVGTPSSLMERLLLRRGIRDDATYGAIGAKAAALFAGGKDQNSDDGKAIVKELNDFRPTGINASGPYQLDVKTLTAAQATLNKVPTAWNANQVQFDKIVVYQGETAEVTPLVLSKDIDYATHGFPPATEKSFIDAGIRIQRPPLLSGPAVFFNYDVYPFTKVEVRQALAYVMKRSDAGTVSLGASGVAVKYMAGVSDILLPLWVSADDIKKLNTYDNDPAKAEALLKGIGFTKGGDGIWVDDKGKKMDYELTVPSDFADWSATAEVIAGQLTKFGVKTTVRGIQSQQQLADVNAGKFTLAIRGWGIGNPHPFYSYEQDLFTHNFVRTTTGKGMNYPLKQSSKAAGGDIDLEKLTLDTGVGIDNSAQKAAVTKLALAYNELLPQIPLWERYGNNPLGETRTTWPAAADPIFLNNPGADSFTIVMILNGTLKPK